MRAATLDFCVPGSTFQVRECCFLGNVGGLAAKYLFGAVGSSDMDRLRCLSDNKESMTNSSLGVDGREDAGDGGDGGATSDSSNIGGAALAIGRPIPQDDNGKGAKSEGRSELRGHIIVKMVLDENDSQIKMRKAEYVGTEDWTRSTRICCCMGGKQRVMGDEGCEFGGRGTSLCTKYSRQGHKQQDNVIDMEQ